MPYAPLPDLETLHANFRYDPETGHLWWKTRRKRRRFDEPAGKLDCSTGYLKVTLDYAHYYAHRLIVKMVTGDDLTESQVDHKNLQRGDNRWENLRVATVSQNRCNVGLRKNNTSGAKGVTKSPKSDRWVAHIQINKKTRHLGTFDTVAEAAEALAAVRNELHREFANHG